ncbi:ribosomal protein S6 kinase delta-1 [Stigmatopora nigra]
MIAQRGSEEFARFYTVTDPTKHQKGYTVYKVTARIISRKNPEDVREITVWKRYSDFRKLHQNLWQLHKNVCSQSELFPPFAKAKVFGRFDDSVIEERRQRLEDLLQFSANIPALYCSQHIQEFFKGGKVHDGSELIGPSEPFSDFLADSLSDSSSDVQRDLSFAEDLTITSEYGGPLSDSSDVNCSALDTDSLTGLDDGMASGRASPIRPHGGSAPRPSPKPGRTSLFARKSAERLKADYLERAGELIRLAGQREKAHDYQAAFSFYRSGVDLLLQGVQGEPSPTRREAVKKKTAEYLMRAEQISSQHLSGDMGQGSAQIVVTGAQCCRTTIRGIQQSFSDDLGAYRVLGVIDKVLLVMDKRTGETLVVKALRKSSDCGRAKTTLAPRSVPHMVRLEKAVDTDDAVFLFLRHAEGGKLWSHVAKYLRNSSPEETFDIPFIQKSHKAGVGSPQFASPSPKSDPIAARPDVKAMPLSPCQSHPSSSRSAKSPVPHPDSSATSEEECTDSYLTLCNEYERDKVEPDALEEEQRTRSGGASPDGATASSPLSGDSLLDDDGGGDGPRLPSPNQPRRALMEFFRIDSKDSAGEATWAEPQRRPSDHGEDLLELDPQVKGHGAKLSKDAEESVPVISFEEALNEDEGHPPDLLVNLPSTDQADQSETAMPHPGPEVATSPRRSTEPDVLPLPGRPLPSCMSSDALTSLWDDYSLTFGQKDGEEDGPSRQVEDCVSAPREEVVEKLEDGGEADRVSRLFSELDQLSVAVSHARIPEAFVRCWAVEMVTALDRLHREGVVCRDLNPNNILLDRHGHVQLTYFCRWSDVEESCDQDACENMYCAPEVGGIGEETAACDWWSLGAVLFELLTSMSLRQCHPAGIGRHTALNVPESLSEEARSLLEQLLQYNPTERLGAGVSGVDDIKSHPFFAKVDWTK